jgi:TetR/AcrR family transcriptional regulator, mexJK operon transcriptional repressor
MAETRSQRKRRAILDAATALFLEGGYSTTSMDDVARSAGVSKQTVYQHFTSKAELFIAVAADMITTIGGPALDALGELAESDDLEADMNRYARHQLAVVIQPRPLQLRRLVIAEARRFPQVGQRFYELGPGNAIERLATALTRLDQRGVLRVSDPKRAAAELNWLIMSDALNRAMLLGLDDAATPAEIDRWSRSATRTFLAAYQP